MKYDDPDPGPGGWIAWRPLGPRQRYSCCDCGMVHEMEVAVVEGTLSMRLRRLVRATGQMRRWMKARKELPRGVKF